MADANNTNFRNKISTVNESGGRAWVYTNKPKGSLYRKRTLVSIILLAIFFVTPFIKVNGEPLFLLNVFQRKFILFGKIFWPQDFHLFVIAMITGVLTIVLFTVIYGRIWCGWACPQTIFMEMVFRKIEFLIEGNANQQRKLDKGGVTFEWVWKKILKHIIFIFLAIIITHTVLSYFIGMDRVKELLSIGPSANHKGFIVMLIFSGVTYFVFSKFREQICVLVCPYGRLQGVMLDANSLVVAYDYKRGEPKAPFKNVENRQEVGKGDCIDCNNCVSVCPTGIDIRNGTQLECINCTACIDACNGVMRRVGLPEGLIRFASENGIKFGTKFKFTPRIIAYTSVVVLLLSILTVLFTVRSQVESTVLRVPGTLYTKVSETEVSNIYNFKTINKTNKELNINIKLLSQEGKVQMIGSNFTLEENDKLEGVFLLVMENEKMESSHMKVEFGIYNGDELIETVKSTFVGP